MAEIKIAGDVYGDPFFTTGTKNDKEWRLGSLTVFDTEGKIYFKCTTFEHGDADFISNLRPGDKVLVEGTLKNVKNKKDSKYYQQVNIKFIQCRDLFNPSSGTKKQEIDYYDEPQQATNQEIDGVNPHSFMTNSNNSEDDLPF